MNEEINEILDLYYSCFEGLDCSPLDASKFMLRFYISNDLKKSLIEMDRRIYHQRQILREFCEIYSDSCDDFRELWERLHRVHKGILKLLKKEFGIAECWIDKETNEIQYAQTT